MFSGSIARRKKASGIGTSATAIHPVRANLNFRSIGQGDAGGDEEPLSSVGGEADAGGEEEDSGEREVDEGQAGGPSEGLAEVGGDGEVVELHLGDPHGGLQIRGVGGEVEVRAGEGLDPLRRQQYHPPP